MIQENQTQNLASRLRRIRHVALDMDGTIYCGEGLFPQTLPFLAELRALGIGFTFLTNNSSKDRAQYHARLTKFGIEVKEEDIFTSTHAAIALLLQDAPEIKRLFAVGTSSFYYELEAAGFEIVNDKQSAPDAVIIGFDTSLEYSTLCKAAYHVQRGLPYCATHPDRVCPTDLPTVMLDCGAVCAAIESATGRQPDAIAGKPEPAMLNALAQSLQLQNDEIAMIGDRIYTDVLMAKRAGGLGVLTLTGETQREDIKNAETEPDLVIEHLGEFAALLREQSKETEN